MHTTMLLITKKNWLFQE